MTFNSAGFSSEEETPSPKHRKRTYMNQPHLRFEITSEDGFSVKANSIEGDDSFLSSPTVVFDTLFLLSQIKSRSDSLFLN